jgi:alkanesulfonate monooxygenase
MKRAWAEPGAFDWHGKHHRVEGAYVFPKPYQQPHPPFYIGGISPAAVDVGAKHANVYLFWGNTPERIADDIAAVRKAATRYSRDPEIRFGMRMQVLVRETEAEARQAAESLIATASERSKAGRYTGLGNESAADGRMREIAQSTADSNFWLSRHLYAGLTTVRHGAGVMVVGDPSQVAATLEEYVALGCTEFCLSGYPHDLEAERFGRLVMPFFRERLAPLA